MRLSLYINNTIASKKVHVNITVYDIDHFCHAVAAAELAVSCLQTTKSFNDCTFILSPLYTWNQFWQNKYVRSLLRNATRCLSDDIRAFNSHSKLAALGQINGK